MASIDLLEDAMRSFESLPGGEGPVVMLNLLRYREHADYSGHPGEKPCSGRDAYRRYAALVMPLIGGTGANVQSTGRWQATVIGAPGETWDDLLMVQYPTRQAFLTMIRSKAYQAIAFHRQAALADSRLIAFTPGTAAFQDRGDA